MLRSVQIHNFRSCTRTAFELVTPLSALCGRNGVGKSTVLNAIAWACSRTITAEPIRVSPGTKRSNETTYVNLDLVLELNGSRYHYDLFVPDSLDSANGAGLEEFLAVEESDKWTTVFHRGVEDVEVLGRTDHIRIPRLTPGLAALTSLLPGDDPASLHLERVRAFFGGVQYYPFEDDPLLSNSIISEREYEDWRGRYKAVGEPARSLAICLVYMHREEPELFAELRSILGPEGLGLVEWIGVRELESTIGSQAGDSPEALPSSKLFVLQVMPSRHMGGSANLFLLSQLSVGTRRIIQIVTSMLFDRRSLMLMEQPEDSIHPGLLRKLISLLRTYSGDTQMLFTTHSPAVLDILKPEEVLLVTADEGSTEVRRLTPGEMDRAKEFLEMEGSLSEFLEAQDDL